MPPEPQDNIRDEITEYCSVRKLGERDFELVHKTDESMNLRITQTVEG